MAKREGKQNQMSVYASASDEYLFYIFIKKKKKKILGYMKTKAAAGLFVVIVRQIR